MSTAEHAETNRRDFLYIATGSVAAVGAALTAWPFINQMNPDASVLALASVEVEANDDDTVADAVPCVRCVSFAPSLLSSVPAMSSRCWR